MKKISNLVLMACFAIAITTAFAFKPAAKLKVNTTTTYYFIYSGGTTDLGDYENPDNWSEALEEDPDNCGEGTTLPCVVTSTIDNKEDFVGEIVITGASVVNSNILHQRQ
jgi:hypothetical protein